MRRICRPEVNQAVVDGVSRSCLKSQTAVEASLHVTDLNQEQLSSSTTA